MEFRNLSSVTNYIVVGRRETDSIPNIARRTYDLKITQQMILFSDPDKFFPSYLNFICYIKYRLLNIDLFLY